MKLTGIPAEIYLSPVEILRLSGNRITEFNGRDLSFVKMLYLDKNGLTRIPQGVFAMPALEILILSENSIETIPSDIRHCTRLKELWIYKNRLTHLPDELFTLHRLTGLYVNSNSLTWLSANIAQLTNLQHLILSSNRLTKLPAELSSLSNLQTLYLQNMPFENTARDILDQINAGKLNLNLNLNLNGKRSEVHLRFAVEECHICMTDCHQMVQLKCFNTHRLCVTCAEQMAKCPFCMCPF